MAKVIPIVRIVDDDETFCMSQKMFLQAMGWFVLIYNSAKTFLEDDDPSQPGCLILDMRMPEMTGLELQHGAFDFLQKPVDPEKLNEVVSRAVEHSIAFHEQTRSEEMIRALYDSLTAREQDVVKLAAMDMSNKDIGEKLFISLPTVKMHRSSAFTKLGVKSALEAYWMLETIGVVEKGAGRSRD